MKFSLKVRIIPNSHKFMACFLRKMAKNSRNGAFDAICKIERKLPIISTIENLALP